MKKVKSLGSIMVVAIFAMALLGPPHAMGESTELCKADEESECASPVSHVHYFSNDMEVLAGGMTYKCDALLLASVGELGAPQVLEGNYTYTSCNNGCERTEENGPAVLSFLKTGHESGEAVGESLVHVNCSGFFNCTYTLEGVVASVKGPLLSLENNGEFLFVEQLLTHESGVFCPEVGRLDATFVPLSKIYISS